MESRRGTDNAENGARARTRRAILDAAMAVFARQPGATLADVAVAADVGRSTVHRYFAERSDLLRALALHVHELSIAAIVRAEPDCGPPIAALRRVVEAQLDLGPIVLFAYSDPVAGADPDVRAALELGDEAIVALLDRLAANPTAAGLNWPRRVFWALLDAGCDAARDGSPRVQVVDAIMTSLTSGTLDAEQER